MNDWRLVGVQVVERVKHRERTAFLVMDYVDAEDLGSAHAYRAESCRRDDESLESFRLWRLVEITTEAGVMTRRFRAGG